MIPVTLPLFSGPASFHNLMLVIASACTQIHQMYRIQFRKAVVERNPQLRDPLSGPFEIGAARLHRFRFGRLGQQTYLRRSQATGTGRRDPRLVPLRQGTGRPVCFTKNSSITNCKRSHRGNSRPTVGTLLVAGAQNKRHQRAMRAKPQVSAGFSCNLRGNMKSWCLAMDN